jgi:gliding motility-associated-like protein
MPNGTGLMGGVSSTMAGLIVPQPGSSTIFYLFTTDDYQSNGANGFRYNIIDMTANGGMGDVVSKNNLLFAPCAEINHAVKHANCMDYWIIGADAIGSNYYAFLLTSSGLITTPVVSSLGFTFSEPGWGTGKFSPDGHKFAMAHGDFGGDDVLQLFDFNDLTGQLSNCLRLSTEESWYGISFSPDNLLLYATGANYATSKIFQWNLSSGVNATILSSKTFIADNGSPTQMQMASDGRIYVSNYDQFSIGVITNPNIPGTGCNFIASAIPLINKSLMGLPAFPESYFNLSPTGTTVYTGYDTTIVYGMSATLNSYGVGNITWSPGTFLSCSNCSSPVITPTEDIEYIIEDDYNGYGCPIHKRIRVKVEYKPEIPNVFTPNGDGQNETFRINNLPPGSEIEIYNRWGELLSHNTNYQNDWKTDVDGVYFYTLLVHNQEYKGFVQVLGH